MDVLIVVVNVACWGTVIVLWIGHRRPRLARPASATPPRIARRVAVTRRVHRRRGHHPRRAAAVPAADDGCRVGPADRCRLLIASTVFAIGARFALGRSWSIGPRAAVEDGLRTDGPYAVTRHPIYTGLLGMMLGSALLGGLGQWLVLPAVGVNRHRGRSPVGGATSAGDLPGRLSRVPRARAAADPGLASRRLAPWS